MLLSELPMNPEANEKAKFLASIGAALIRCQTAERLMVACLSRVFPDGRIQSIEMFEQLEENFREQTLGQLIGELRERVGIDEAFNRLLSDFLDDRNTLVHIWEVLKGIEFLHLKGGLKS
jgi:hypothetical protein